MPPHSYAPHGAYNLLLRFCAALYLRISFSLPPFRLSFSCGKGHAAARSFSSIPMATTHAPRSGWRFRENAARLLPGGAFRARLYLSYWRGALSP